MRFQGFIDTWAGFRKWFNNNIFIPLALFCSNIVPPTTCFSHLGLPRSNWWSSLRVSNIRHKLNSTAEGGRWHKTSNRCRGRHDDDNTVHDYDHLYENRATFQYQDQSFQVHVYTKSHYKIWLSYFYNGNSYTGIRWHIYILRRIPGNNIRNTIKSLCYNGSEIKQPLYHGVSRVKLSLQRENKHDFVRTMSGKLRYFLCLWWDSLVLTHGGLVTPYGDRDLGQHWLR